LVFVINFMHVRENVYLRTYEVTGEWRNLHKEELSDVYSLGDKIEKSEVGGACRAYGGQQRRIQGFGGET
jgi:hypothetical protein